MQTSLEVFTIINIYLFQLDFIDSDEELEKDVSKAPNTQSADSLLQLKDAVISPTPVPQFTDFINPNEAQANFTMPTTYINNFNIALQGHASKEEKKEEREEDEEIKLEDKICLKVEIKKEEQEENKNGLVCEKIDYCLDEEVSGKTDFHNQCPKNHFPTKQLITN